MELEIGENLWGTQKILRKDEFRRIYIKI